MSELRNIAAIDYCRGFAAIFSTKIITDMFAFNYEKRIGKGSPFTQVCILLFFVLLLPLSTAFAENSFDENPFSVDFSNIEYSEEASGNCNCPGSNSSGPIDNEPPIIVLTDPGLQGLSHGDTLYVGCGQSMNFDVNSATAVDNCDPNPHLEFVDYAFQVADCHQNGFYKKIVCGWVGTDECNNKDSIVITFLLTDDTPPIFDPIPDTLTVECSAINTYFPTATDACGGRIFITRSDTIMPGDCQGQSMIMRSWIANDVCGNQTIHPQVLMVEDTRPPVLTGVPDDLMLSCEEVIPDPAQVTVMDNCTDDVMVSFSENSRGDDCNRIITRRWTATDDCGNETREVQRITIVDETAPAFLYTPSDSLTVECDQPVPNDAPTFRDNCDPDFLIETTFDSTKLTCGWIVVRTWTATDRCDNETFFEQKIVGIDTQNPTFDNAPDNMTVECDDIPAPVLVTASDNCDADVLVELEEQTLGVLCGNYRILRTWTATDNCGNFSTHRQRIDIVDTTSPELFGVPDDETLECNEVPDMPTITATDNCDSDPMISLSENITGDSCFLYLERTWTAMDACGNTTSGTQTITFTDFSAPFLSFSHPDILGSNDGDTIRYECTDVVNFDAGAVSASDNCDDAPMIDFSTQEFMSDDCEVDGFISRIVSTWTATDNCGNSTSISLMTLIIDTTDPILLNVPDDITINCEDPLPLPPTVNVNDNCDDSINAVFSEDFDDVPCGQRYIRTWTATDDCGNFSVGTQNIFLVDNTAPVAITIPDDVTIECDDDIPTDEPTWEDACMTKFSVTEDVINTPMDCGFVIQKTWTATDDCGNSAQAFQIITAVDNTPPVFDNAPADTDVSCDNIPTPPVVTANDNCDMDVAVTFSETMTGAGDCDNLQIVRTWTAEDDCGNQATIQQILTITDDVAPVLTNVPADVTIECDENVPPSDAPTVTDNCDDDIMLTVEDVRTDGACIGEYTIARTWTATDDCGNTAQGTQTITSVDRTAPVITFVHPFLVGHSSGDTIVIQCDNLVLLDDEDAEATDNCSPPVLTFDEVVISSGDCVRDGYFEILQCTWTATDDCGNQSVASVIVVVKDDTAPVFSNVPGDRTLNCGDPIPMMDMPTVVDNCDPTVFATVTETPQGGGCAGGLNVLRTWTATDICGNTATATQLITYVDNTPPTLTFADPDLAGASDGDIITLDCNDLLQLDENTVTADDFCDTDPDVDFDEVINSNFNCATDGYFRELVCTWTATDACGNAASIQLIFRLTDIDAPVFDNVPADISIECDENLPDPANVTATDACSGTIVSMNETTVTGNCPGEQIITRIWTATDDCGNSATASQVITQEDTTPPTATIPDTLLTRSCDNLPPIPTPVIADNCGFNPLIEFGESRVDGSCENTYTLLRTWKVTDGCGNITFLTQTVNVEDTEAPILSSVPTDISVSCDAIPPVATVLMPSDNCDSNPMVAFAERQTGTDCTNFILIREWTVTDACGNSNVYTQNINLTDTTPPTFVNAPSDMTVDCENVPPVVNPDVVDDCDTDPVVSFDESRQDGSCSGEYILTRTWTVTDRCGNSAEATQILTVVDNSGPSITLDFPGIGNILTGTTVSVECDSLPVLDDNSVVVTDCGGVGMVDFVEKIDVSDNCAVDGYLSLMECTWIATDGCGNTDSLKIFVRVVDTQAPVLAGVPANDTVYLAQGEVVPPPPTVTATDNCDLPDVQFTESSAPVDDCSEEILRVWTVSDHCGNTTLQMQIIFVTTKVEVDEIIKKDPSCGMADGSIGIYLVGDPANYTYTWSPDLGTPNAAGNERTGLGETKYTIQAFDPAFPNCVHTFIIQLADDCLTKSSDERPELVFKNGISPNGDYKNEYFIIDNVERYQGAELTIFNHGGGLVFKQKNYRNDWRGTTKGGKDLPDGTYFYVLRWEGEELGKGYLQILR